MRVFIFIFPFIFFSMTAMASSEPECGDFVVKATMSDKSLAESLREACEPTSCSQAKMSRSIYNHIKLKISATKAFTKKHRGYAFLITTMVASAAVTSHLTSALPKEFIFLSQLISQISTIGIYVMGAPLWEPISSKLRQMAFGVGHNPFSKTPEKNVGLEDVWQLTQQTYSLNAQMSRNIVNSFITSSLQNFFEAYRAARDGNEAYAIDQIAAAAVRYRHLFSDLPPDNPDIALAVRTTFTQHVSVSTQFRSLVSEKVLIYDPDSTRPENQKFYEDLLRNWLGSNH